VTWLFLPDVSQLDIAELDKLWACVLAGRPSSYSGPASADEHLSVWEKWSAATKEWKDSHVQVDEASVSIVLQPKVDYKAARR
jgi:hypothetical protein